MLIHTSKFRLLSMEFEHLEAIIAGQNRLQEILNVTVPANWPRADDKRLLIWELRLANINSISSSEK